MNCMKTCSNDFSFIAGETQVLIFHLRDISGGPYNATGYVASYAISEYVNNSSPVLSKKCSISGDQVTAQLSTDDTIDIPPNKYIYQLTVVDPGGNVEVPARGFVLINKNINRSFITKE